jgi:hypothetical protein
MITKSQALQRWSRIMLGEGELYFDAHTAPTDTFPTLLFNKRKLKKNR